MKGCLLLAILFLKVSLRSCQSSYEEQETPLSSLEQFQDSLSIKSRPQDYWKRYNDIDYDTFVGLMGRRNSDPNAPPPNKRDMDDAFMGLMGRRSTQSSDFWRKEEYPETRRKLFFNKEKLMSLRGV